MRYFRVDVEPTKEQAAGVHSVAIAIPLGLSGFVVLIDDGVPDWLEGDEEIMLNVPGEPHRCRNCGEPI